MRPHDDNTLDRDLHQRAAELGHERRQANLVARAVELAHATRADDRAWGLVRLAADLRALERYDEALYVLDLAWQLSPSERPELATFTCAIAIHCDREDHDIAVKLERDFADRVVDFKFGRACLRLYSELYAMTEADVHRARRESYRSLVDLLESEAEEKQSLAA